MYWIIKIDQQESDYVPPLLINECGAMIWDGLQAGYSVEDLSKKLHDQYGIELMEAFNDVSDFIEQLTSRGIMN